MPSFNAPDRVNSTPFGKNQYLRSTKNVQFESYTCAKDSVAEEDWTDGVGDVHSGKVLQSGEAMAKITSGADAGKIGPFQLGATDGRQTAANLVGLNDTFAPWQLNERDVDVAVLYHGVAHQSWCTIRDANGTRIALTDAVADALRSTKGLDINFHG